MTRWIAIVAALLAAPGCSREPAPARAGQTPIILISVDTLRADRLPAWGYGGVATPHLDRLRSDSILYRNAYSHSPLTLPSHATIFTGQLPADTGIRDNIGYQLAETADTLADHLRGAGYATGGAVSSYVLRSETGIAQGFELWDDVVEETASAGGLGSIQRRGAATIAAAKPWIAAQTRPLFFFLHLYEPHTPYTPPEPYASRYADRYDGEVAYSDALIGEFLDFLRDQGTYDDALILFFSDHGEGLGDHGEDEHGIFLYREAIHVPLLVKLPAGARAGTTVETPVQLSDIFPTVLELSGTGGTVSAHTASLLSFTEHAPADRRIYSETQYPRLHLGWSDLHSLVGIRHHFIHAPRPELYDLAVDPGERNNAIDRERRIYSAMRNEIQPLIRPASPPSPVGAEEAARLAALGYLGSGPAAGETDVLPDPKEKLETLRAIQRAFALVRERRPTEAAATIERILDENPRMSDLWAALSTVRSTLGRNADAIEAAKRGLQLAPTNSSLALQIAALSFELGRLDDAAAHAQLVLTTEPVLARDFLARVALENDDLATAELEARKALEADADAIPPLLTLARIETHRGNLEGALRHLDAASGRAASSRVSGLHFLRGDLLARLGRLDEAEAELRREIELFPESPPAYRNLALLLVARGRSQEATALIFKLAEASPTPPAYQAIVETLEAVGDEKGVRFWARRALSEYPDAVEFRRYL